MIALFLALLIPIICYALSWIVTCGLFYLLTLCFGWEYSWAIATGVWILFLFAKSIFSHNTTIKQ